MPSSTNQSYLIIGAGIFGAGTALELREKEPQSKVTIVDRVPFPSPSAASHDVNKIIRADYEDTFYMKLALEAQDEWRNNTIYKPYYHEPGMLYAENRSLAQNFLDNYKAVGHQPKSEVLPVAEARQRFGGVFQEAYWEGVTHTYFNPCSGWGEAAGALRSLVQAAVDRGAEYKAATISALSLDEHGACRGAFTEGGEELVADHIVLAAGAWTPWLLAESAPKNKKLHAGDRILTAGAIQCRAIVPPEAVEALSQAPILFSGQAHTDGESLPLTSDGYLKCNYERSFTNRELHEKSGKIISVPPKATSKSTWGQDVPQTLKDEVRRVVKHTYGDSVKGLKIESYRMCWDAVTPNQDWIIGAHPHCKNLSIATGGSFHSWKFMPVLGKLAVQMLQGQQTEECARRFSWDRDNSGEANPEYIPRRDLKDLI